MSIVTVPPGIPCATDLRNCDRLPVGHPDRPGVPRVGPGQPVRGDQPPRSPPSPTSATSFRCTPAFGAAAAGGGWTFVPAISLAEIWTDNVLNTTNNRRWDFLTIATPSIAITGRHSQRPGPVPIRTAIPPGCQDAAREQLHQPVARHRAVHHRAGRVLRRRKSDRRRRAGGRRLRCAGSRRYSELWRLRVPAWHTRHHGALQPEPGADQQRFDRALLAASLR